MPVGFSSAARNLFLLGSSGAQVVTNFFESISKASTTDGVFIPNEIRYNYTDQKYVLAGSAADSNSKGFGWLEKQDYNLETGSLTTDYSVRIESSQATANTTLRAMELDSNDNLIVVGKTADIPWIAKYSNAGVLDWQSTTNTGDVEYTGITSDSNGNYYACGNTPTSGEAQAFVEKFDANGNPGWGKSAFMLGRDVVLEKISANERGEVVAVGFLEDDSADKGYIVKIDTNTGEVLWDRTLERNISGYGGGISPDDIAPANVKCTACYIDSNDQIYVVGTIDGNSPVDNGVGEFLIKYSPEGNIIWQRERDTNHYTILDGAPNTVPFDVKSDGETEQTVVLSVEDYGSFAQFNSDIFISKYSKNGDLVFRRKISKGNDNLGAACLDADPSFYYILFRDQRVDALAGEPDRYTFGKVSTSGNGLGNFQYNDGTATLIDYTAVVSVDGSPPPQNKIGRLSDGSVTNSVSDLITYPFTANNLVFDDLATQVSNKKRQMDGPDSFEYSGSPAIRPADFQELNLLGDNVSGRTWNDTSGKGNNGVASLTEPFFGAGGVSFDGSGDDLSVPFNSTLLSDFTIELWVYRNNTNRHCFISLWDTSGTNRWRFEVERTAGKANFTDTGSNNNEFDYTSSSNEWVHWAISRQGTTARMFENGIQIGSWTSSTTLGVGVSNPLTIGRLGGGGTDYVDGFISNVRIVEGTAIYTSNFTPPTTPLTAISGTELLTCQGDTIADASSNNFTITVNGNAAPTDDGPTHNAAGYWEFDGTDDYITMPAVLPAGADTFTIEAWVRRTGNNSINTAQVIWEQNTISQTTATRASLLANNTGTVSFSGQSCDRDMGYTLVDNEWTYLVCTVDTSDGTNPIKFYLNGDFYSQGQTNPISASNLNIGTYHCGIGRKFPSNAGNPEWWNGDIGEVRIYPRALTPAQVFQNYNATKSKYIDEGPDTAPKISDSAIVYDSNLLLNYDFGNRSTYDDKLYDRYINGPVSLVSTLNSVVGVGNDRGLGNSVDVGSGKIVGGERTDDDAAFNAGQITICDLDGSNVIRVEASDAASSQGFGRGVRIYNNNIYVSKYVFPNTTLYRYDMNGTNETTITLPSTAQLSGGLFDIDKDNGKIVCGDATYGSKIHVFNSDGTGNVDIPLPSDAEDPFIFDIGHGKVAVGDTRWSEVVASGPRQTSGSDYEGRVYVYDQDGTNEIILRAWDVDEALAKYPDYDNPNGYGGYGRHYTEFGAAVAIGKDIIVVGSNYDFDKGLWAGAIYIFDHNGRPIKKVTGSTVYGGDNISTYNGSYLGETIKVTEDRIYVSAPYHHNLTTDGTANGPGAVFVFDHQGNELGIMTPPTPWGTVGSDWPTNSQYGGTLNEGIAIGENKVVIGSQYSHPIGGSAHGAINIYDLKYSLPTTVKNLSSTSFPGTINGATFNSAGYFENSDSSTDKIYLSETVIPATGAFTVEWWYQLTGNNGRGGLFEREADTATYNGFSLGQGGAGNWSVVISSTSNYTSRELDLGFSSYPSLNTWYHEVAVFNGTNTLTLYRNAVQDASQTSASNVGNLDAQGARLPLRIGYRDDTGFSNSLPVNVGEVRVYSRALSATEVSQNFNATRSKYGV